MRALLALMLLVATVGLSVPVAAQEVNVTVGSSADDEPEEAPEAIDRQTRIVRAFVTADNERMVLVLESDVNQRVVLTDAGAVYYGGEVPRKRALLREGENRVSMPVSEVSGRVAVTIDTGDVLYAKTIRTSTTLLAGPFSRQDVYNGALGGGLGVALLTGVVAYRKARGMSDGPRRLL